MNNNTSENANGDANSLQPLKKICVIGAGNVATHLAQALSVHANVVQIVSRHIDSASALARLIGPQCTSTNSLADIVPDADLYLLAVSDNAIANIVAATPDYPGIWAHTSGSVPADLFAGKKTHYGVFYPLQTFTRSVPVDMSRVPMFIEGNTPDTELRLATLAQKISPRVKIAHSRLRSRLHVAAVFACNFANLMWLEADKLLQQDGLDITFLMPLLEATLAKLRAVSPREAMTGPARRADLNVIEKHLDMLPPDQAEIYRLLTNRIIDQYYHNE